MLFAETFPIGSKKSVCAKKEGEKIEGVSIHDVVYFIDGQAGVDVLHCGASILHSIECLLINVCGFDGVDFALERHDLGLRLLK